MIEKETEIDREIEKERERESEVCLKKTERQGSKEGNKTNRKKFRIFTCTTFRILSKGCVFQKISTIDFYRKACCTYFALRLNGAAFNSSLPTGNGK